MASVNVNRSLSDQFYRYKMPKLLAKVEGKGNGIKTVIVNMVDIAKSLNRPPMYPTKYFGCVLGAQVNYDTKNERYIVNGSHESGKLQDLLDGFIQKYVLCPSCHNPETVLAVNSKRGTITTSCQACGYTGQINNKDRLTTFILKNPPSSANGGSTSTSSKEAKKSKKGKKEDKNGKKQSNGDASNNSAEANDSNDGIEIPNGLNDDEDEEEWGQNLDPEATAKRLSELTAGVKSLVVTADLEKSPVDRLTMFFDYLKKKKQEHDGIFSTNVQKDIVSEADRLDIKDKSVLVLCEILFDENILQQIETYRVLFLRFTAGNAKAQKYLLRGLEQTVQLYKLMAKVSHILKAFYDNDILEEAAIMEWGSKTAKKPLGKEIREKAEPFLKWLKEAEEEDSESDEDENQEIEVVYDDRCRTDQIKVVEAEKPKPSNESTQKPVKEENDIDIDAI